jgi:hypothetical protein
MLIVKLKNEKQVMPSNVVVFRSNSSKKGLANSTLPNRSKEDALKKT